MGITPAVDAEDPAAFPIDIQTGVGFELTMTSINVQSIPSSNRWGLTILGAVVVASGILVRWRIFQAFPTSRRQSAAVELRRTESQAHLRFRDCWSDA